MSSIIQLERVTKRFGSTTALDDVSLDIPSGVVFALLGENGAGKTTAIRILLGLEEVSSGRARVLGLDSRKAGTEIRRRVGYVPESPTLYEWMTVEEIGWFTAGFYGGRFLEEFLRLADQFDLPRKRKLTQLSKGMRAKVVLSLSMAHQPELLILDEPTSGLDTMVRREFLESMVDLAAQGQTVLLSSHQIGEVERVADIVAMVHRGRVVLVERLDVLKEQTYELIVTMREATDPPPTLAGEVLRQHHRARQWQLLVRDGDAAEIDALERSESIVAVESRTPALEEIFVAYMRSETERTETTVNCTTDEVSLR